MPPRSRGSAQTPSGFLRRPAAGKPTHRCGELPSDAYGAHHDFAAIDILSQVLGDTPSGRLHKALVESKKASSSFGFNFQWREPAIAIFGAEVRVGTPLDPARETLVQTVEGFAATPPSKEEVDRARAQLRGPGRYGRGRVLGL